MRETLGILPGVFRAWIDLVYPPGSAGRAILEAYAYDNAHDTNTSDSLELLELPDFGWDTYDPIAPTARIMTFSSAVREQPERETNQQGH